VNETAKKIVLLVVALGAFGIAGYMMFRQTGQAQLPTEYRISGVCLACKQEATATSKLSERPPFECQKCRKAAVFPWFYCGQCNKRFVPNLERRGGGPAHLPVVPACPKCGSTSTGAYFPDDPDVKPAGDLPLPTWP
jgi:hypothetical protein